MGSVTPHQWEEEALAVVQVPMLGPSDLCSCIAGILAVCSLGHMFDLPKGLTSTPHAGGGAGPSWLLSVSAYKLQANRHVCHSAATGRGLTCTKPGPQLLQQLPRALHPQVLHHQRHTPRPQLHQHLPSSIWPQARHEGSQALRPQVLEQWRCLLRAQQEDVDHQV